MNYLRAFPFLLVLQATGTLFAHDGVCSPAILDVAQSGAGMRNVNIVEALLIAGQRSNICFGVDVRNTKWLDWRFNVADRSSVSGVFKAFGGPLLHTVEDNVVVVRIDGSRGSDWLDVTMPRFHSPEAATEVVGSKVFAFLFTYAHPHMGSVGSISHRDDAAITKELTVLNGSVRRILNKVVSKSSRGGIWFTTEEHPKIEPLPGTQFWTVLSYADPLPDNEAKIRKAVLSTVRNGP